MHRWGGKHQLSSEAYHQVPLAWQAESLLALHQQLGGWYALGQTPRLAVHRSSKYYAVCHHSVWYNLADGIRAGDAICTELAVRFILAHLIVSYSGYARQRLLRALKHAELTASQKQSLSSHFLQQVQTQNRERCFNTALRLWKQLITPADLLTLREIVRQHGKADQHFTAEIQRHFFPELSLVELDLSQHNEH